MGKTIKIEEGKIREIARRSEREQVRREWQRRRILQIVAALMFVSSLGFLVLRAGRELKVWISEEQMQGTNEKSTEEAQATAIVVDEVTGSTKEDVAKSSARLMNTIAELEQSFGERGYKINLVRIPADKLRELDLELEGIRGIIKVSIDRGAGVSAEDADRMIRYLRANGIEEFEYIDVRIARKAYWK